MPYHWNAERERLMLLAFVCCLNPKPPNHTWETVAQMLGEGLTASAVSQKFHKMKKDASLTPSSTPTKRKALSADGKVAKVTSTKKRAKKSTPSEDLDGQSFPDPSSFQEQLGPPIFPDYDLSPIGNQALQIEREQVLPEVIERGLESHWSRFEQERA